MISYALGIASVAFLVRLPFLRFPLDEDFATWTYRARFKPEGLKWKQDMFCFYPTWRMHLLDSLYGSPENGVFRIRIFLATMHVLGSLAVFFFSASLIESPFAAFLAASLYAFFGPAPAFSSESFNFEQIYVPLIITGLYSFQMGPNWMFSSGLCFGLAVLPKVSTGIFFPGMMVLAAWQYGLSEMTVFATAFVTPVIASHLVEWNMGYLDTESKLQFNLRLAVTLRCSRLKQMYGSIQDDILTVLTQTLPVWIMGSIGLILFWNRPEGPLFYLYAITTLIMIFCQKGFSRYHYFPMMAVWAIPSAIAFEWIGNLVFKQTAYLLIAIPICWSATRILSFYRRPLETRQLARYEKYDQWLYVPYLGKLLKRYFRKKGETKGRLFVWGNYVQLYHMTGKPAADQFVHYALGPWDDPILAHFFDTVIGGLLKHRPSCFVKAFPDFDMDLLRGITGLDYRLLKVVLGRFPVYRLESVRTPLRDPRSLSTEEKLKLMDQLTQGNHVPGINRLDEERGRYYKALAELRKLVKKNPWDTQGHIALAGLYERMGKINHAAWIFEKLIVLQPKYPEYRNRLAKLKLDQGRVAEGKNLIESEARIFGETASVRFHRGILARIQGAVSQATAYFESVLKDHPDWNECRFHLAELHKETRDFDQARNYYETLWNQTPKEDWWRTQAAIGSAVCNLRLRPESDTLAIYLQRDPGNEPLAYAVASALEREGHKEQARRQFKKFAKQFRKQHLLASAWFRLALLSPDENRDLYLKRCLLLNPLHDGARRLLKTPEVCRAEA